MNMLLTSTGRAGTIAQLLAAILIFIFVLALTYIVTKWLADFQKVKMNSNNITVIETYKVTTNKYLQIVKIGGKYFGIAICKDTITLLGELQESDIKIPEPSKNTMMSFKELLEKAKK